MNSLRLINELKRKVKTVKIKCSVTTINGETKDTTARIVLSKLNQIQGNGLSSKNLYDLVKLGSCQTKDVSGNVFKYEILPGSEKSLSRAELQKLLVSEQSRKGDKND